ncbi:MAG: acyl-ACP--UDP-N-acetylglucosamine O-acyltransferase [Opitutae bacterium]|nr:acyl-ACP--UDP-N-acetylglucosamine O-acyltransferase [Opitutae bacterium]
MIHPTAIIEPGAKIDENVEIGAYAYIGGDVTIGAGTRILHHAVVEGFTTMGRDNVVYPFAVIGGMTQDLKYKGGKPGLKIGDRNSFREYVTVHVATNAGDFTTLGNDNNILAYSHVAHDCKVGNFLIMSSQAALAGHVVCGDHVNIAWGTGVHQFCRVGSYSMIAALSRTVQDVPPFIIVEGAEGAHARMLNIIGLQRNGFSEEHIANLKQAFRIIYHEDLNRTQALEKIEQSDLFQDANVRELVEFYKTTTRGVC